MDLGLKEKSVVITGGGSNIGRALVLGFAAEGARITIGDIDETQAGKVAELARAAGAADVQVVRTDVTQRDQAKALMDAAVSRYGAIDALVNNVGWDQLMFFMQTTPDFWEKIIRINFHGVLNCTHAALEKMIPAGSGSIVSISSDASRQGEAKEAVYGGMKAAVNSFMKTIAKENGRYGIRCNCVCPGVTIPETEEEVGKGSMWAKPLFTPDQLEKVAASLPLKKVGRPRDIANSVVFLSSPLAAGHVTGHGHTRHRRGGRVQHRAQAVVDAVQ